MPQVTVRAGATVHYNDEGEGLPLLLAHGFMLDASMFEPMCPILRERCRVITWDARAHGATRYDGQPFSEWDNVDDLIALMDALGIERAVVGGHSQGGFIAMSAALRDPDRVMGLVLINTTPHGQAETSFADLNAFMAEWLRTGPTRALCEALGAMVLGGVGLEPWIKKWMAQPAEALMNPFRAVVEREDISDRLANIKAPALVVHSTADVGIPLDEAHAYARQLPGAGPVFVVEGAPHASCCTHPELVAREIIHHLDRVEAAAAPASNEREA